MLTNKILLLFISTIIVCIIGFIFFTLDKNMVIPNPKIESNVVRHIKFEEFDEIEIRGNRWDVEIVKADTFGIIITGSDNLVNNYLSITKEKNKLLFNVSPQIKESIDDIELKISLPRLKRLFADNSNHPIKVIHNNNFSGPSPFFFGEIVVKIINFREGSFNVDINGKTTVKMEKCRINNLNANASNLSKIYIEKSNIKNVKYNLTGASSMKVIDFEGRQKGTLTNFTTATFVNKKGQRKVYHSKKYISTIASFGEMFPGLKWGSTGKKVHNYFTDQDALNYSKPKLPESLYGMHEIIYTNFIFNNMNIETLSARFSNDFLVHFQIEFHDSVSITKIDNWLTNNFGKYETERKKSKTWKVYNDENKEISRVEFIHITTKTVMISSSEWNALQYEMYYKNKYSIEKEISPK